MLLHHTWQNQSSTAPDCTVRHEMFSTLPRLPSTKGLPYVSPHTGYVGAMLPIAPPIFCSHRRHLRDFSCYLNAPFPKFALSRWSRLHETIVTPRHRIPPHSQFTTLLCSESSTYLSICPTEIGSSKLTATHPEPSKMCRFLFEICNSHKWCYLLMWTRIGLSGYRRIQPTRQTTPSLIHHGTWLNLELVFKLQDLEAAPDGWIT